MALVRNVFLAPDPGLVARGVRSWPLHTALRAGPVIGRVIGSRDAALPTGTLIRHKEGWRTHTVVARGQYELCLAGVRVPPEAYLGVLGHPGLLARVGVEELADVRAGETVLVAPAGGSFGAAAARLVRLRDAAMVIGGADRGHSGAVSADFDVVIDCQAGDLGEPLLAIAPRGVHAAILSVAPDLLVSVLRAMAERGRVTWTADAGSAADPVADKHWPAAGLALVHRYGIRLTGYRAAHFEYLRDGIDTLLTPECEAGRLAVVPAAQCDFDDLPKVLARIANGSSCGAEVYQIADL
jgi:NADPH-dependent curcumin reductase CurA